MFSAKELRTLHEKKLAEHAKAQQEVSNRPEKKNAKFIPENQKIILEACEKALRDYKHWLMNFNLIAAAEDPGCHLEFSEYRDVCVHIRVDGDMPEKFLERCCESAKNMYEALGYIFAVGDEVENAYKNGKRIPDFVQIAIALRF